MERPKTALIEEVTVTTDPTSLQKTVSGEIEMPAGSRGQLSEAVEPRTICFEVSLFSRDTLMSEGQMMVGIEMSATVTIVVQLFVFPFESVAVEVTV